MRIFSITRLRQALQVLLCRSQMGGAAGRSKPSRAGLGGLLLTGLLSTGCNMQKDADVDLPVLPPQLVAECYLESGKIPEMSVTESVPYLSSPEPVVPTDVTVVLTDPAGRRETLRFRPGVNPQTRKGYTHRGQRALIIRPGDTYRLDVTDARGRHLFGTATMPETVPIDTVEYRYNNQPGDQRRALILTRFTDPAGIVNFYRYQVHRGKFSNSPATDYTPEDRLLDGTQIPLGTSYEFRPTDTATVTLYNLGQPYYNFLRSVEDAQSANGNPFGQPAQVQSTVEGGIGVFAILNYQRRTVILKE